jgi:L-glyceraldehyde 3-phosphate reductase
LGLWQNFGDDLPLATSRAILRRAFDRGVTHFDLANNYGTPPGNAEIVCGHIVADMPRDELIISSKAGYRMWPGPYGDGGSRKYLIASCDQSLGRMGLEYFDIFYSHRFDKDTPLEETLGALNTLVEHGKALYIGVSSYSGAQYADAVQIVERNGWAPITIHQPYYNMLGRGIEKDLLGLTARFGTGVIPFCPLASGLLTDKYLAGDVPSNSRAAEKWGLDWVKNNLSAERLEKLKALNAMAKDRGQSLAQMALAWTLRLPAITSALIGASSVTQIEQNVAALTNLEFTEDELKRIDDLVPA